MTAILQVGSVVAAGLVEGPLHVNWKLLTKIALWWVAGFVLVMLATAAVIAQGNSCPNCHFSLHQLHEWCLKLCVRACVCACICVCVCVHDWSTCKDLGICNWAPVRLVCHCVWRHWISVSGIWR